MKEIQARLSVAHFNTKFFGMSETFIYQYLSHFERVYPICLSWGGAIFNNHLFPLPTGELHGYDGPTLGRHTLRFPWDAAIRRLTRFSCAAFRQRALHHIDRLSWAKGILTKKNVSLIHAHFGPMGWLILPLKKLLRLPLVTSFYGFDTAPKLEFEGSDWSKKRQELFHNGDLFLVEGPAMGKRLVDLGCQPEKIQIQRLAIHVDQLPFRKRELQPARKTIILFAGRFTEKKGLIYALGAVKHLVNRGRRIELRMVGDGQLAPELHRFVQHNNLEHCVKFAGFLNHSDCLREMEHSDIFLHPSVVAENGDTEGGAPTVILEAQALGLPVVSTYHADIPNVTVPGKSAILVPERDADALAIALVDLIDHPQQCAQMGQAGRAHVERNHNIVREVLALEEKDFRLLNRTSNKKGLYIEGQSSAI